MEEEDEEEFFCMLKWFLDVCVAMEICFLISSVVTHTHTHTCQIQPHTDFYLHSY